MRPGIFAFPKHQNLIDVIRQWQPSVIKAFANVTSDSWWAEVKRVAPDAIYVLVHGEISDNPDLANPRGDAESTARLLDANPNMPRLVISKNELPIWEGSDYRKRVADYLVTWIQRAHEVGFDCVVGELNSGWPKTYPIDTVDWWPEFSTVEQAMGQHDYWGLHEYWGKAGPLAWWPWTIGRHLRCPTKHNILIGECGFDAFSDGPVYDPHLRGWGANLDGSQYVEHIVQYHRLLTDPRVKGTCLFLLDYDDNEWVRFDLWPIRDQIVSRLAECDVIDERSVMPSRLMLPVSSYVRITQTFIEHPSPAKGLDLSCYQGTPVLAAADGIVDKVLDWGDRSYGRWVQINHWWGFTRYAHLSFFDCQKGDWVKAGQQIGKSGSTGRSTGPHLHFEVLPFNSRDWPYRVDPAPLLGLTDASAPPSDSPEPLELIRNAGWNAAGVPYNPAAAFTKYARAKGLGAALGPETDVGEYRVQPFRDKILYARIGHWDDVRELDY